MPTVSLTCHPTTPCRQVDRFDVEVSPWDDAGLCVHYLLEGELDDLRIPGRRVPRRADGLWRHTCLEAFLAAPADPIYHEFNFSPSTEWAVYRFDSYREGMSIVALLRPPELKVSRGRTRLELEACIAFPDLPASMSSRPLAMRLGITAVIETAAGECSYWALQHPVDKPDFHHPDSFVFPLEFPMHQRTGRLRGGH